MPGRFGLAAPSELDYSGDQGAFYWGERGASSPADVWRLLREHGISHLVWAKNLDHGTDFATTVAGMPVNLPSHAHGQGYSDLTFLIPELGWQAADDSGSAC